MSLIKLISDGSVFFVDGKQSREALDGSLREQYRTAEPFPHIVLDDFLPPEFLDRILDSFPSKDECSVFRNNDHTQLKRGYRPEDLGANACRGYLGLFNTGPFLQSLEDITGITGLIPDPYFAGGGLHEIDREGKLGIHADFNWYPKLGLIRRINVLVYLNKDWRPEYRGNLELWDAEMTRCVRSIAPLFNRCVIFTTNKSSFHGHPDPLACPPDRSRRSIALYYYTSPPEGTVQSAELNHRTDFLPRPGTADRNGRDA